MPKSLQDIYGSYPDKIVASPWATQKIKAKPPWKIGYIAIGISNPYNNDVLAQLKKEFALAKAKGLVTGSLQVNIPPSLAQSTPESQISAIKDMVRQGVNAIIVNPADSVAESPAMEAAGKAGVPIILADVPPAPGSKYQTSTWTQNQVEADAGTLGIIKKGDILIVRGIAGNQNDKVLYNQKVVDLKNCPEHQGRVGALRQLGQPDREERRVAVPGVAPAAARGRPQRRRHVLRHRPGVRGARHQGAARRDRAVRGR